MEEIIQQAIEKLNKEKQKLKGSCKVLCEYLLERIVNDEQLAKGVLDENKSMATCWTYIFAWVRKNSTGNSACFEDEVVVGEAIHYFTDVEEKGIEKENAPMQETAQEQIKSIREKIKSAESTANTDCTAQSQTVTSTTVSKKGNSKKAKPKMELEEISLFDF